MLYGMLCGVVITLLALALIAWAFVWWRGRRAAPGGAEAAPSASPGKRLRQVGQWLSGVAGFLAKTAIPTPSVSGIGTFVAVVLNVVIGAVVLGIVGFLIVVGLGELTEFLRGTTLTSETRLVIEVGVGILALTAIVAVFLMAIRSGPFVWRTNIIRVFAIILLVAVVLAIRPVTIVRTFGSGFSWWGGEKSEQAGTTLDAIVPAPLELTAEEAAMRAQAIINEYQFYLNGRKVQGILDIIARVRDLQWRPFVQSYAREAGIDPARIEAVIATESEGNPDATSNTKEKESLRARGLMQLIDGNARTFGRACGIVRVGPHGDSYDPEKNICAGVAYLRALLAKYRDWELALAGYNWGTGNLDTKGLANFRPDAAHPQPTFWALKAQNLIVNMLHPGETEQYVPRVLAWEYILKYFDAHGRLPPWDGQPIDLPRPLVAGGAPVPSLLARHWGASKGVEQDDSVIVWSPPSPPPVPQSNVWYTVRSGENFGGIVVNALREDPAAVAQLNPDLVAAGLDVAPGALIRLPEERYAFHRASGRESYRDIAGRYRMTTAELLRWSGRWDAHDAWLASRRDCPPEGCEDELAFAAVGEQLLVRRQ